MGPANRDDCSAFGPVGRAADRLAPVEDGESFCYIQQPHAADGPAADVGNKRVGCTVYDKEYTAALKKG
ncbi:MAG: hypothetical protein A2177_05025 [Spirochaetes bacterium RBG_13_68_11]|nr:MAG: hypothetical protein A2177_05025 [Spirochaetes bacterium RBG_13_68_11]